MQQIAVINRNYGDEYTRIPIVPDVALSHTNDSLV